MPTFTTTLLQQGNNVGIEVPDDVVASFGVGKRVPVIVTVKGYSYASTVVVMGGRFLVGVNAAHRAASGVRGGETLDVTLEHDAAERTVDVPQDLADALDAAGVRAGFDGLSYTRRKEAVRQLEDAKTEDTRRRRLEKTIDSLT